MPTNKPVLGEKTQKHTCNKPGVRRNNRSSAEDVEDMFVDNPALSRMLDVKLAELEKMIINGLTDWFVKNTIISSEKVVSEGDVDKRFGGGRSPVPPPPSNRPHSCSPSPSAAAAERTQGPISSSDQTLREEFMLGWTEVVGQEDPVDVVLEEVLGSVKVCNSDPWFNTNRNVIVPYIWLTD